MKILSRRLVDSGHVSHLPTLLDLSPFAVFLAVFLGLLIGQVEYKGIALGSSGILVAGLVLGFLGFRVEHAYWNLSLLLFVAAVGLLAAEDIERTLTTHGLKFLVIGVAMTVAGAICAGVIATAWGHLVDPWLLRASYVGAHTSSPGLAAMLDAAPVVRQGTINTGYSATYLFGIVVVILFVEVAPLLFDIDMPTERRRFLKVKNGTPRPDPARETSVSFSLVWFSLTIILGVIIDQIHIPLGPLGSMTVSVAGGTLLAGIAVGYLGNKGPIHMRLSPLILRHVRDVGLGIFLAVTGIQASATFMDTLVNGGIVLVLSTLVIALVSILVGYVLATVVWDLDWINTAGAIAGGMTNTPALGAAITTTDTEEVGAAYGATYPFALLGVVVSSKVLVMLV